MPVRPIVAAVVVLSLGACAGNDDATVADTADVDTTDVDTTVVDTADVDTTVADTSDDGAHDTADDTVHDTTEETVEETAETTGEGTAPADGEATITIADFAFDGVSEVPVGTAVVVTNTDDVQHTWTAVDGPFDSGALGPGDSFEFTFTEPGEFDYVCNFHPSMTGTIVVTA